MSKLENYISGILPFIKGGSMKKPNSLNSMISSLEEQEEILRYYLKHSKDEAGSKKLQEFRHYNRKIKDLIDYAGMDRKVEHARFLNKIRGLGFVLETQIPFWKRLKIAFLFVFKKLDPDKAVNTDNPVQTVDQPSIENKVE